MRGEPPPNEPFLVSLFYFPTFIHTHVWRSSDLAHTKCMNELSINIFLPLNKLLYLFLQSSPTAGAYQYDAFSSLLCGGSFSSTWCTPGDPNTSSLWRWAVGYQQRIPHWTMLVLLWCPLITSMCSKSTEYKSATRDKEMASTLSMTVFCRSDFKL